MNFYFLNVIYVVVETSNYFQVSVYGGPSIKVVYGRNCHVLSVILSPAIFTGLIFHLLEIWFVQNILKLFIYHFHNWTFDVLSKLCFVQTKLYTEDWIGLKALDEAGKVKFFTVSGDHLDISHSDMKTYIVPYLKGHNHIVPYLKNQMKEYWFQPSKLIGTWMYISCIDIDNYCW